VTDQSWQRSAFGILKQNLSTACTEMKLLSVTPIRAWRRPAEKWNGVYYVALKELHNTHHSTFQHLYVLAWFQKLPVQVGLFPKCTQYTLHSSIQLHMFSTKQNPLQELCTSPTNMAAN
jgi:hypothetical protein